MKKSKRIISTLINTLALALPSCHPPEESSSSQSILADLSVATPESSPNRRDEVAMGARRINLIKSWILSYTNDRQFGEWGGSNPVRRITAALYAFANPGELSNWSYPWQKLLAAPDRQYSGGTCSTSLECYQRKVLQYLSTVRPHKVGTGGDYDFALMDVLSLIYLLRDRPDVLTNDMLWGFLCQNSCKPTSASHVPFSGNAIIDYLTVYSKHTVGIPPAEFGIHLYEPQTENHVAMIYTWRYLVNQWVREVAGLPQPHPRFDRRVLELYKKDPAHYGNEPAFEDFIMKITARVVWSGLFETNARPYSSYTVNAILNLADFAGAKFAPEPNDAANRVRIGALNAADTQAAMFAFQSLEGKRVLPIRRSWSHRRTIKPGQSDYIMDIFGALSGNYLFEDRHDTPGSRYHYKYAANPAGFALSAALRAYRVPGPILEFMRDKHNGFWTRAQSRYSLNSYPIFWEDTLTTSSGNLPSRHAKVRPKYFQNSGTRDMGGSVIPAVELAYITNNFMAVSGGQAQGYYDTPLDLSAEHAHDYTAKPHMLIPGGLVAYHNDWSSPEAAANDVLLTKGHERYWFASGGAGHMYKGLTYGYIHRDHGKTPNNYHNLWPQLYPTRWHTNFLFEEFGIARAAFRVFDFSSANSPIPGTYLILAAC